MKYLSTFEIAEKWGISPRRVGILYVYLFRTEFLAHKEQEAAGSSRRMQKNQPMPALKAGNTEKKRGDLLWDRNIFPVILHSKDYRI